MTTTNKQSGNKNTYKATNAVLDVNTGKVTEISDSKPYKAPLTQGKKKDDLVILGLLGGMGTSTLIGSAKGIVFNDEVNEQINKLTQAVKMVGGILGSAGLATFAFQAALTAADLIPGKKKGAKAAASAVDKPLAKAVAETADKPAAKAAAETVVKTFADDAAKAISKPAVKGLFGKLLGGASVLAKGLKKVPLVGAVITGGFVAYEVGSFITNGEGKKAFAAATAGGAEMAGNIVGFGAGDALREGVREAFIYAGGEGYEDLNKSDIRYLAETGTDLYEQFNNAASNTAAPIVTAQNLQFKPALAYN